MRVLAFETMASTKFCLVFITVLNILVSTKAAYERFPNDDNEIHGALKHSLVLKCIYKGEDGDGHFGQWYKDNASISSEKPGHYHVHSTKKESVLTIKIFVRSDSEVKSWYVLTKERTPSEAVQCQFKQIPLKPSPQAILTNDPSEKVENEGSIRRFSGQQVSFQCLIEPSNDGQINHIKWEFSKDHITYSGLPASLVPTSGDSKLLIEDINKEHRGYYRCTVNDVSFTVLLRVKDRFAALWPFIGIVSIVLVLVIVILIFEKRQKSTKKVPTNDDDDNDHAKDPLMRSPKKSPDNESKKRAVKA